MKRKYYVFYYRNFSNTYRLYWTYNEDDQKDLENIGAIRITKSQAIKLCQDTNKRRKLGEFESFSDNVIYPYDYHQYVFGHYSKNTDIVARVGYVIDYK